MSFHLKLNYVSPLTTRFFLNIIQIFLEFPNKMVQEYVEKFQTSEIK